MEVERSDRKLPLPYVLPVEYQKCIGAVIDFAKRKFKDQPYDIEGKWGSQAGVIYWLIRTTGQPRVGDWPPYQIELFARSDNCKLGFVRWTNGSEFEFDPKAHPEITLE
jgi:hypothetical protein